jgi:hypothetical protein
VADVGVAGVAAYEARFGWIADEPITRWDDFSHADVSQLAFEEEWAAARAHLGAQ